jgi:hypothetical protein
MCSNGAAVIREEVALFFLFFFKTQFNAHNQRSYHVQSASALSADEREKKKERKTVGRCCTWCRGNPKDPGESHNLKIT